MEQISLDLKSRRQIRTVAQLNAEVRVVVAKSFEDIWVAGEVSNLRPASSGHLYFVLKDATSQISCVCYRSAIRFLRYKPQDGMAALVRGRLDVYVERGVYQVVVDWVEPQGLGDLQVAFEQLQRKLESEGLFAAERKRPMPKFPQRIGIVTSPDGAAIRDLLTVLDRRFPGLHIRLYPALVQGAGSVEQVIDGILYLGKSGWPDVVIVGRGGGSLEDLWTFNEEAVARAIAACPIPVVSAVGHETDYTIADFVADLRAPTPSAAAELVAPNKSEIAGQVTATGQRGERAMRFLLSRANTQVQQLGIERATGILLRRIGRSQQRLDDLDTRGRDVLRRRKGELRGQWQTLDARLHQQDLRVRLSEARRRLGTAEVALDHACRMRLAIEKQRLDPLTAKIGSLSPLRILERGYAIVQTAKGHVVTSPDEVRTGDPLDVRLHGGRLRAKVS